MTTDETRATVSQKNSKPTMAKTNSYLKSSSGWAAYRDPAATMLHSLDHSMLLPHRVHWPSCRSPYWLLKYYNSNKLKHSLALHMASHCTTLSSSLNIKLSPICFARWSRTVTRWGWGRLSSIPEIRIFQIQCVTTRYTSTFNPQFNRDVVTLSKNHLFRERVCLVQEIIIYLLFARRRTTPVKSWPCLTKRGVSKRQRTWYQWVNGSVGAVDSQIADDEPKNATSNQKASPWTKPDWSEWNSKGISKEKV